MSSQDKYDEKAEYVRMTDPEEMPEDADRGSIEEMEALERQRVQRRRERMAVMRQRKRRQELIRRWSLLIAAGVIVAVLAVWGFARLAAGSGQPEGSAPGGEEQGREQPEGSAPDGEEQGREQPEGSAPGGEEQGRGQPEGNAPGGEEQGRGQPEGNASGGEEQGRGQPEGNAPGGEGQEGAPGEQEEAPAAAGTGKGRQYTPPGKGKTAEGRQREENYPEDHPAEEDISREDQPEEAGQSGEDFAFSPCVTERTAAFPQEGRGVYSTNGILIDVETQEILACRDPYLRINPASMTKILTLLVAAEHVQDLEDTFTMTAEIADYVYRHDCSIAGFGVGEKVTVEDLLYGTILPSGAEAAMALAEYVAGSQEAFVEMMNQKLEQLGLSDSAHFTNCVGLYDENHYCTVYDMALILKAATDNELCRRVMSARKYTTSVVTQDWPEGILLSNWFLRRIEDKDTHGEVLCAKTGYVDQSGNCAASLAADSGGREYICVTTGSISSWACIYDHVEIYQAFLPSAQE